jgi:hypothetical protein
MKTVQLCRGQVAIFGYGSLLNIESLEGTLGHQYTGPFEPCWLNGWRRTWNIIMPNEARYSFSIENQVIYPKNIIYLNIRPSRADRVRGVLFAINEGELQSYDSREWIYDRYDMAISLQGILVTGGPVFAYVGKTQYEIYPPSTPYECAVRASYLATIDSGLENFGANFSREYYDTSDPVPHHLIIQDHRVR